MFGYGYISPFSLFSHYFELYGVTPPKGYGDTNYNRFLLLQYYLNIFTSRFEYKNMPEELEDISAHNNMLELMLFFSPSVAWFEDEKLGLQCLPTSGEYDYTITGLPTSWRVVGANGYQKKLNEKNSVIMFNDRAYSIPFLRTMYELGFMTECDGTIKQELLAHRRPLIMEMEEDEKKSADRFLSQLQAFKDVIAVRKRVKDKKNSDMPYETKVFEPTARAFEGKLYTDFYTEINNRILTYYGIKNVQVEKRERLLTGEISANDTLIQLNFSAAKDCRTYAVEKVNKMFGCNINVEPNELFALEPQDFTPAGKQADAMVTSQQGGQKNDVSD